MPSQASSTGSLFSGSLGRTRINDKDENSDVADRKAASLCQNSAAKRRGGRAHGRRVHFRKDIAEGTAEATATITAAAYGMAVSGKYPVMTRFWLSTVGRGPAMLFDPAGQDNRGEAAEEDSADAEEQISAD